MVVNHLTKHGSGPGSHIVYATHEYIARALKIAWIPSHSDIVGNTKADDLAYIAARGQSSPADDLLPLLRCSLPFSVEAERRNYSQEISTMWKDKW